MPAYISIADNDDAGEWASVLPFCLNIAVSDYAGGDHTERLGPALLSVPFHAAENDRD